MRSIVLALLISSATLSLLGCSEAKNAASFALSEAIKSKSQREAENICLQAAVDAEARRTRGLKTLLNLPAETQFLSENDFLIKFRYKKITIDDPGEKSDNLDMYSDATCEVKNGKVVDGHLAKSIAESISQYQQ